MSELIQLAHGGGGRQTQDLISGVFRSALGNPSLDQEGDSAVLPDPESAIAFTTDSYVVRPLFFPGGDIGKLAVYGTVNDLAMVGARPLYLSLGVILEEGLPLETLRSVVASIRDAAAECGVSVVTGDTKVVERGKADGLYLSTSGIGRVRKGLRIGPREIRSGDRVIVSGDLGRHGIAILSQREGLRFDSELGSDCAPLHRMVQDLLESGVVPRCMRDLTRGGLAAAMNEVATSAALAISLEEAVIPVPEPVRGACELLGLDPLSVANEGRMAVFVEERDTDRTLAMLRRHAPGREAAVVGTVLAGPSGRVTLRNALGVARLLDMPGGELLPRIC